jgi:hypothetical protein
MQSTYQSLEASCNRWREVALMEKDDLEA